MRALLLSLLAVLMLMLSTAVLANNASAPLITVESEGTGPDVILIPGLASSRDVWGDLSSQLTSRFRLHKVQLAGFAGQPPSSRPDGQFVAPVARAIAEYIKTHSLSHPAIIGHSLGGEVALLVAAQHPDLPGRVAVVDALPFFSLMFDPGATPQSVTPQARQFRQMLLTTDEAGFKRQQQQGIARLVKTDAVREQLVRASLDSDRQTLADATFDIMTLDLRPQLSLIRVPVTVLYAWDPQYGIPAARVDALYANAYGALKGVQLRRIDNSFHFMMYDQPEAFTHQIKAFLQQE
ncbi:alpha/beta hydrolase [Yokenella regensburgei]|uniref:alpha/beta fold hydrolase n=1 Tax=Yokenella regensburgei TaxID=158877 RepID=UPI003F1671E5